MCGQKSVDCVNFVINGRDEIRVPKSILETHSDYFQELFDDRYSDSDIQLFTVDFTDIRHFQLFVQFLYTPFVVIENVEMALQLFKISDTFKVSHIKLEAAQYLLANCGQLSRENILKIFIEAEQRNCEEIMKLSLNYLLQSKVDVTELTNFDKLSRDQMTIILKAFSMDAAINHRNCSTSPSTTPVVEKLDF